MRMAPFAVVGLFAALGPSCTPRDPQPARTITLELVDAESGETLPGWIRIEDGAGRRVEVKELLPRAFGIDRMPGVKVKPPLAPWSVAPGRSTIRVPAGTLTIEAFSGLETERARVTVQVLDAAQVRIPLRRFYTAGRTGYRSGNTHLHLQRLTRAEADRYLLEIPRGDGLEVVFLANAERPDEEKDYISNLYTAGDLKALSKPGLLFGLAEEHRHNFQNRGEGYGHVMFLGLRELIRPVSVGPGIMKTGTDGTPAQVGIDAGSNRHPTRFGQVKVRCWYPGP